MKPVTVRIGRLIGALAFLEYVENGALSIKLADGLYHLGAFRDAKTLKFKDDGVEMEVEILTWAFGMLLKGGEQVTTATFCCRRAE